MAAKSEDVAVSRTMRDIVAKRLLQDVIGAAAASCDGWMVLVMDTVATRVISSVLGMFDIMEAKVTLVEQLYKTRQPFREMEVIYLITASEESMRHVLHDFESAERATYGDVHLFFLTPVSTQIMQMMRRNSVLCSRIKTFKEINLEFLAPESYTFSLDIPDSLVRVFGPSPDITIAANVARKLSTVCVTLNEYPNIRFQASSRFCEEVARILNDILRNFAESNRTWWHYGAPGHNDRDRAVLLIADRSLDPLSPLMHEYTYQSMVYDLLPMQEQQITYTADTNAGRGVPKQVLLNDNDDLWVEFRHVHIARVIEVLRQRMQDFVTTNAGAALAKESGKNMSLEDMAAAVKQLPEFQETMGKLSQHIHIAGQCMSAFTSATVFELSQVEQTLSTGVDEEGREVKAPRMLAMVQETLVKPGMTPFNKIRLVAIYIISQRGISETDRRSVISTAGLDDRQQQVLLNFERLGVSLQQSRTGGTGLLARLGGAAAAAGGARRAQAKTPTADDSYADSRHVPRLREAVEQLIEDRLPTDQFRSIGPAAGSASAESKAAAKSVRRYGANSRWGAKEKAGYTGGRLLVFMAGGICYGEIRAMYDLMTQHEKEIVTGGTHFIGPKDYVKNVQAFDASTATLEL